MQRDLQNVMHCEVAHTMLLIHILIPIGESKFEKKNLNNCLYTGWAVLSEIGNELY